MKIAKATLLTLLTFGAMTQALATNLVTNGSFETGDLTGWSSPPGNGSDFGVETEQTFWGTYCMKFSADGVLFDSIYQVLNTTAGQTYTISMWVKNYGIDDDSFKIGWEGAIAVDLTPVGTGLESWQFVETQATATTNGSMLLLAGRDNAASFYVDDIRVQAVPEPMTLVSTGAGIVGLLLRRRTRRK